MALLLARGLTNRQVAEALVISERTASTHVTHILNKLGVFNTLAGGRLGRRAEPGGLTVQRSRSTAPPYVVSQVARWMESMVEAQTRTVTFLLTDVEGSTAFWEQNAAAMRQALVHHDALLTDGIVAHGGAVVKSRGEGDSVFAVFDAASDAVTAAVALQSGLQAASWPTAAPLRVRMALHTARRKFATATTSAGRQPVRPATLGSPRWPDRAVPVDRRFDPRQPGGGGQLASARGASVPGSHRPETAFQVVHPALSGEFPPLRSLDAHPNNLPRELTSFVGREREVQEVKRLLTTTRLLTLTGSGGVGKTRLSQRVAVDLVPSFSDGIWLVELAGLGDPSLLAQAVATALGIREQPAGRSRTPWWTSSDLGSCCSCWTTASTWWRPARCWRTACSGPAPG